jgi:uncharacterized protein YneF (UPF0154 family)
MFGKVKDFATRKLLERQLRNAPPDQRKMIMTLMEKNPALMEKIAKEIKTETKAGSSEMTAAMKVMPKYQAEIQKTLGLGRGQSSGTRFNPNGTIHK